MDAPMTRCLWTLLSCYSSNAVWIPWDRFHLLCGIVYLVTVSRRDLNASSESTSE